MNYQNIREEELKNRIGENYFWLYDYKTIIGNVDFCVSMHQNQENSEEKESLLWAEAKKGIADIYKSLVQLILTIGKARTFEKKLPPAYLGAFDAEKIAFIPYNDIHSIFYINDFNWNVAPSNHETKEFKQVLAKVKGILDENTLLYYFGKDDKELKRFIQTNFVVGKFGVTKTRIDKNNFIVIYNKWLQTVKPTIAANWDLIKKSGLIDGDFYLADLLSHENITLREKLFVLLHTNYYELDRKIDSSGFFNSSKTGFTDKQLAHTQFWNKYERPPKEEYWDYIVERRDLLVPQDVRERKGSFFTPQIWVELSQKYLADVLGEDWQDEYYIWDCAAGTGNLLAGLTNKSRIFASTLDKQDVDVMKDRIQNGANLIESHVFQFDFLNDSFDKLPKALQEIVNSPEKRKKLVIYINPPYAEATDGIGQGGKKIDVSKETKIYTKYGDVLKKAKNELFAQFLVRIYKELDGVIIGQFSTLKILQGANFFNFRQFFLAKLQKMFIVPADTFDNVTGQFPIGFMIWHTAYKELFTSITADVYNKTNQLLFANKTITAYTEKEYINKWVQQYKNSENNFIGFLAYLGNDFQNTGQIRMTLIKPISHLSTMALNTHNIIPAVVYFAVRHCIKQTWLNNQDQFLYPQDTWQKDTEFQHDCLAFTLFYGKNLISSKDGTNHWIPFTEQEVQAKTLFSSSFMTDFIKGKLKTNGNGNLLETEKVRTTPLVFSAAAKAVFDAGRELWRYYHSQSFSVSYGGVTMQTGTYNVNASLYDIKEFFQQRNANGKMNNKSDDEKYNELMSNLREALKVLAQKIEPKVYEHGFLKK